MPKYKLKQFNLTAEHSGFLSVVKDAGCSLSAVSKKLEQVKENGKSVKGETYRSTKEDVRRQKTQSNMSENRKCANKRHKKTNEQKCL